MERNIEITSEYIDSLFRRVKKQIAMSRSIIAKSRRMVAQSKSQIKQHTIEIESYLDAIKIRRQRPNLPFQVTIKTIHSSEKSFSSFFISLSEKQGGLTDILGSTLTLAESFAKNHLI